MSVRNLSLLLLLVGILTCFGAAADPSYAGAESCRSCHAAEYQSWQDSHHDLAMQKATEASVLGNFNAATFSHNGITSRFFRDAERYLVNTEGPDGKLHDYQVDFTFGVEPLQQYLVRFPGGRFQALSIAWDSRAEGQGGQRWFHLYPDEVIPAGDELHWTAPAHNWNYTCAECHSTNLVKGYDLLTDSYQTTWSEVDVACEACHGPGADHVNALSGKNEMSNRSEPAQVSALRIQGRGNWKRQQGAAVAALQQPANGNRELTVCGRCHSRRHQFDTGTKNPDSLSQTHKIRLLEPGLYFPDGQILDEVFVYGSFAQSRMQAAGVTCSDCHDPHSLELVEPGNAVCLQCHDPGRYDGVKHHFHESPGPAQQCVNCHMPERTYMQVDPRRDHSFRIPQPVQSINLGVPNACNQCHVEHDAEWAETKLSTWYGASRHVSNHSYAHTLQLARSGGPGARTQLLQLADDPLAPAIARATAVQSLAGQLGPDTLPVFASALQETSPLLRIAAIESLQTPDSRIRWQLISPLLSDPVLGVRIAAAAALADVPVNQLEPDQARLLEQATDEYVASELFNSDRAESWVNLAGFRMRQRDPLGAELAFVEAKRRNSRFVPLYVNYADLLRAAGRDEEGEEQLREGLALSPDAASLHHSLGLLLVRAGNSEAALKALHRAFELGPGNPRLGFVYGVALQSSGQQRQALDVWQAVVDTHQYDTDTLDALSRLLLARGETQAALPYAVRLKQLRPGDGRVNSLFESIRGAQ